MAGRVKRGIVEVASFLGCVALLIALRVLDWLEPEDGWG